jgi:hypothetical protein
VARCWWLTLIILAIQEAEIGRIKVQSQPRQIVRKTLFQNTPLPEKKMVGGVAQGVGPEFKPPYQEKNHFLLSE